MRKALFIFTLAVLLVACSAPQLPTLAPTPQAIYASYPPSLKPWGEKLSACAVENPLAALYIKPYSSSDIQLSATDIVFSMGEPAEPVSSTVLTQVGKEKIVIVVNRSNTVNKLSIGQLQEIISGQTTTWENGSGQPVQLWVYPPGDPVRTFFDQAIGMPNRLAMDAMLAPDLQAMLEAVAKDENAVGYLTETFINSADPTLVNQIKILQVDPALEEMLTQPVIAMTQNEPTGLVREILVCLQSPTP